MHLYHVHTKINIQSFNNEDQQIYDSEISKYFNTLCIYTMFTLKLIFNHLIMKISIQDSNICHCNYSLDQEGCSYFSRTTWVDWMYNALILLRKNWQMFSHLLSVQFCNYAVLFTQKFLIQTGLCSHRISSMKWSESR